MLNIDDDVDRLKINVEFQCLSVKSRMQQTKSAFFYTWRVVRITYEPNVRRVTKQKFSRNIIRTTRHDAYFSGFLHAMQKIARYSALRFIYPKSADK